MGFCGLDKGIGFAESDVNLNTCQYEYHFCSKYGDHYPVDVTLWTRRRVYCGREDVKAFGLLFDEVVQHLDILYDNLYLAWVFVFTNLIAWFVFLQFRNFFFSDPCSKRSVWGALRLKKKF